MVAKIGKDWGRRGRRWFGAARLVGLAVLAAALTIKYLDPGVIETLQLKTFDLYVKAKPRERTQLPVAIVDIDEKSMATIGQWPWPRTLLAELVGKATAAGAVAIAFDIVFAEPDRLSPARYADSAVGLSAAVREELRSLASNDAVMAGAMKRARVVVGQSGLPTKPAAVTAMQPIRTPIATIGGDPTRFLPYYPGILRNVDAIESTAAGRGLFSIRPEFDGIIRRIALFSAADDGLHPALSIELLRIATGGNAFALKSNAAGIASVVVGGVEVPTDSNGRIWVNYTRHDRGRYVSAADIINGAVPPGRLAGHLLLVGTSAVGLGDLRATPLDPGMPGVEVHAQLLETILSKSWLERPHYALGAEFIAALLVSLLVIALVPILGAMRVLILGGMIAAALATGGWLLFDQKRMLLDTLFPLATSFAVFMAMTFMNYLSEERQRQSIRNAFAHYLSPAMVEQLAQNPDRLELGGEVRELTLLFSDVRGFTAISETYRTNPQGLTRLMNRFLTPLSNAIIERKGTIDKYMGDAVMAFWNAPLDDPDHATNGCAAALEMAARLDTLNAERRVEDEAEGRPHMPMLIGIGINTGVTVVGNMGSDVRFDYSVLGDTVNVASRLEGQTKDYGVTILVGSSTAAAAQSRFALIEADLLRVKGKDEPERVYVLVGDAGVRASPAFQTAERELGQMLAAYRAQRWDDALACIAGAGAARSLRLGGLLEVFAERIEAFKSAPPPAGWDGVYVATTK